MLLVSENNLLVIWFEFIVCFNYDELLWMIGLNWGSNLLFYLSTRNCGELCKSILKFLYIYLIIKITFYTSIIKLLFIHLFKFFPTIFSVQCITIVLLQITAMAPRQIKVLFEKKIATHKRIKMRMMLILNIIKSRKWLNLLYINNKEAN